MKTMLIITGPQGSGNHLFSKIFALHENVYGWKDLLNEYWIAHDFEPFSESWNNPKLLEHFDWNSNDFYVTSISCPYANKGIVTVPNYESFINKLISLGISVKIAIIGRDQNILKFQQQRVRDRYSYPDFQSQLGYLEKFDPIFLSTELLYLYKDKYLKSLSSQLSFPIKVNDARINEILKTDSNTKYFQSIQRTELDTLVRSVSGIKDKI